MASHVHSGSESVPGLVHGFGGLAVTTVDSSVPQRNVRRVAPPSSLRTTEDSEIIALAKRIPPNGVTDIDTAMRFFALMSAADVVQQLPVNRRSIVLQRYRAVCDRFGWDPQNALASFSDM